MKERLIKLLRLARRAEGHESDTAWTMLHKLLDKYGYSLEDIDDEATELRWYRFKGQGEKQILHNIIWLTFGDDDYRTHRVKGKKAVGVHTTKAQDIQIREESAAYFKAWRDQLKATILAFISVNDIYGQTDSEARELSPEELAMIRQAAAFMSKTEIRKALEE